MEIKLTHIPIWSIQILLSLVQTSLGKIVCISSNSHCDYRQLSVNVCDCEFMLAGHWEPVYGPAELNILP